MKKYNYILGTFLFLSFLYFSYSYVSENGYIKNLNLSLLGYLLILKMIALTTNALFNIEILKVFDVNLNLKEGLYLSSVTFLGNLLLPARSGGAIRLIYLNKKYKLKKEALISQFSYFFVVSIFINSFFLLISMLILRENLNVTNYIFLVVVIIILFLSSYLLFKTLKINTVENKNRFLNFINKTKQDWQKIVSNFKIQKKLIIFTLINFFVFYLETHIILSRLFVESNVIKLLFFNSSSVIGSLIGVTPGSLGLKEAFILFASTYIDFGLNEVLSYSIVDRGAALLFSLVPIFISYSFIKKNSS